MKLNFNGFKVTPSEATNKILIQVNSNSRKRFTNLVERIYKGITDIRHKTRQLVQDWLKSQRFKSDMPDMFTNLKHGNDIRHNMLLHIVYDLKKVDVKLDPAKMKARFTIPYGIATTGNTGTIKNSRGFDYAKALDSNKKFSRFNGFRKKISTEYRGIFVDTFEARFKGIADATIYKY